MTTLTTTFDIPTKIAIGLIKGDFERVGGVVRDAVTKQVVMWLREAGTKPTLPLNPLIPLPIEPVTGVLNLVASLANTGITVHGFNGVNTKLDGITTTQQQISSNVDTLLKEIASVQAQQTQTHTQVVQIGQSVQQMQSVLQITSAASILNLGVSVVSFVVITQRLNELENRLKAAQEILNKINRKIDLGFYANFRAALDLAASAFTMSKVENRRSCALKAIDRFLEAEHIYADYVDQELEQKSQIADEYLLTLSLAYLAEVRCHLELEEFDTALRRFQEGAAKIRSRIQKYVELLLTSNPAAYLHPQFKGQIDLRRLTKVYQWLDPSLDENAVFELQRENLYILERYQSIGSAYKWVESLPSAIVESAEVKGSIFGNKGEMKDEAMKRLPQAFEVMESMIETNSRFESYEMEIKAISQLGISFHDWLALTPSEPQPEGKNIMYILPSQPLALN